MRVGSETAVLQFYLHRQMMFFKKKTQIQLPLVYGLPLIRQVGLGFLSDLHPLVQLSLLLCPLSQLLMLCRYIIGVVSESRRVVTRIPSFVCPS